MCSGPKQPDPPDPPPPPPPPPRFVDPAVIEAKLFARSRFGRGGFSGTIAGRAAGVTDEVNLISNQLLAAN